VVTSVEETNDEESVDEDAVNPRIETIRKAVEEGLSEQRE
jgi:hypothetical protein